jgi:pyrroloquinoline-quinone synthase
VHEVRSPSPSMQGTGQPVTPGPGYTGLPMAPRAVPRRTPRPQVPTLYWDQVAEIELLDAAVHTVARAYNFRRHPYFLWVRHPDTSRVSFRCSQVRFRFAVEGWSQALSAVLARVPWLENRRGLARNIADEHGEEFERSHKASFQRFLAALGTTPAELRTPCPVAVRAFQQATTNFCLVMPYEAGAAALGIVEQLYIGISTDIVRLLAERGWAEPGSQDHYALHEELDVTHARDLLELAGHGWGDRRSRREVALGLLLGAHHFWQLYLDIMPAG